MLTADDRLVLIRTKIERAKKHIFDLQGEVQAFFDSKPYVIATKQDPQTRRLIYYVESVQPVPISIALIIGDAFQNIRSALDHLAWHLVDIGCAKQGITLSTRERKQIGFPIIDTDSPTQYEASREAKVKGMTQAAIDAIDAAKPYKGGNDPLWRLSQLNNIDKHRLLITVSSGYSALDVGAHASGVFRESLADHPAFEKLEIEWPALWMRPANRQCPLKAGSELFIDGPDAKVNNKMQFAFDIALSEPQIIECEPIDPTIVQMLDYVDNLILSFRPMLV